MSPEPLSLLSYHLSRMRIWPGHHAPLGATFDGIGTNFSLFSEVAERVELCLFDDHGAETRVDLPEITAFCWHGYLPGVQPGQRYGFRVHGPWAPEQGPWCNPAKLLLDPVRQGDRGRVELERGGLSVSLRRRPESSRNDLDSAPFVPKSVVINPFFDWGSDRRPRTPWHQTVVYETHVKGFTEHAPATCPTSCAARYAGLAHPDGDRVPAAARRHRGRADAGAPVRPGLDACASAACATTGATTRSATSRRTTSTPPRPARRAGAGVQADGEDAARGRASR